MWTKKAVNLDAEIPKWTSGQGTEKSGRIKVPKQHRAARVQEAVYGFRKRGVTARTSKEKDCWEEVAERCPRREMRHWPHADPHPWALG